MEIERKFLIKALPDDLDSYPCVHIEQGYLNTNPVVRIRKQNNDYILTYKGKGMLAREEYNLPLNEESYVHLKAKCDGNIISKKLCHKHIVAIIHNSHCELCRILILVIRFNSTNLYSVLTCPAECRSIGLCSLFCNSEV